MYSFRQTEVTTLQASASPFKILIGGFQVDWCESHVGEDGDDVIRTELPRDKSGGSGAQNEEHPMRVD